MYTHRHTRMYLCLFPHMAAMRLHLWDCILLADYFAIEFCHWRLLTRTHIQLEHAHVLFYCSFVVAVFCVWGQIVTLDKLTFTEAFHAALVCCFCMIYELTNATASHPKRAQKGVDNANWESVWNSSCTKKELNLHSFKNSHMESLSTAA